LVFSAYSLAQSSTDTSQKQASPPQSSTGIAQSPSAKKPVPEQAPDEENPPEEDESLAPKTYTLNPLESERNIKVGNFYWHRGKFRAAADRYRDATRYNPSSAEAFFKLGEAEEKLKNKDSARVAFQRVMQISPDSKLAQEAKKKISAKS
jgi:tetratricopeptide (TPR) repeat protein